MSKRIAWIKFDPTIYFARVLLRMELNLKDLGAYSVVWTILNRNGGEIKKDDMHEQSLLFLGRSRVTYLKRFCELGLLDAIGDFYSIPYDLDMARGDRIVPPDWPETRMAVFRRDSFTCRYCGRLGGRLECDHIIPVARGGSDDISNLATACAPCNRSKGAKRLEVWGPSF